LKVSAKYILNGNALFAHKKQLKIKYWSEKCKILFSLEDIHSREEGEKQKARR